MDLLGGSGSTNATVVALRLPDGTTEAHRLGAESVDDGIAEGDAVTVERMMAMVVGVRRAP